VNFAAETHVDRSILDPGAFVQTDITGVYVLCEAAKDLGLERLHHVSTDEVYGPIPEGKFKESDPLRPTSPYAASKAGGDLLARSYFITYGLPITITRGVNTYGPYQYPEKVIPLFVTNAIDDQPLPLYGDGQQVRDRLHVLDHARGIDVVLHRGQPGEVYNVAADCEKTNLEVARMILRALGKPESLIQPVKDRAAHDVRYALETGKIGALGWEPQVDFAEGFEQTVRWYVENQDWWRPIKSGEYWAYYRQQYVERV
jgi:dTDP-glucose 4,6-dehydratase